MKMDLQYLKEKSLVTQSILRLMFSTCLIITFIIVYTTAGFHESRTYMFIHVFISSIPYIQTYDRTLYFPNS